MSRLLYYVVLMPLSRLPLPVLYLLSDGLCFILHRIAGFRKKVVYTNLRNAFPERSEAERRRIAGRFYRHFCDLLVESIRMFRMSREEVLRRCRLANPELVEEFARQGKSLIIAAGHYGNWELAAVSYGIQSKHTVVGIYKPLANAFFDRALQRSRGRFGMELLPIQQVKPFFAENTGRLTATLFATDQSPSNSRRAHWMEFLNQDTAVLFGAENYARKYDFPLVYGKIRKLRRGYYEMEFVTVEANPVDTAVGEITEKHTRVLEGLILEAPEYWLWSHKRWKRKREEGEGLR